MAKHFTYTGGIAYCHTMIDSTIKTATSDPQSIAGAKGVGITFFSKKVDDTIDRKFTMTVLVSMDGGITYSDYKMLIPNVTNDNSETLARVDSSVIDSAEEANVLWFSPETLNGLTHFKVTLTRDTEGTKGVFSVNAIITY